VFREEELAAIHQHAPHIRPATDARIQPNRANFN
jgi:hypothetical protein